ncbi:hypothetical protein D3C71_1614440 [compost metagenome]
MQPGQDQFHAGDLLFRVDVHRHAAAVIADLAAAVLEQHHFHRPGVAGQGLIDRVVDDFLRQMVRARGVGVHARAALDRVQAGEDFDVGGVVTGVHVSRIKAQSDGGVCGLSAIFARGAFRARRGGARYPVRGLMSFALPGGHIEEQTDEIVEIAGSGCGCRRGGGGSLRDGADRRQAQGGRCRPGGPGGQGAERG